MYKIKSFIIHTLGGYTQKDVSQSLCDTFRDGKLTALYTAKMHADKLNGICADSWCKDMYSFIEDNIKSIEEIM